MRKWILKIETMSGSEGWSSQVFHSKILCSLYAAKLLRSDSTIKIQMKSED